MVQFTLGVTRAPVYKASCHTTVDSLPDAKKVSMDFAFLVLDYSNDNGLTWATLESWPLKNEEEKRLGVVLPSSARTPSTILRWWQLTRPGLEIQSNALYPRVIFSTLNASFFLRSILVSG